MDVLGDIAHLYSSALVSSSSKETDFLPILNAFFEPLLERLAKDATGNLTTCFRLNIIEAMLKTLESFYFLKKSSRYETLTLKRDNLVKECVQEEESKILKKCGDNNEIEPTLTSLSRFDSLFQL
eukprot:UN26514